MRNENCCDDIVNLAFYSIKCGILREEDLRQVMKHIDKTIKEWIDGINNEPKGTEKHDNAMNSFSRAWSIWDYTQEKYPSWFRGRK